MLVLWFQLKELGYYANLDGLDRVDKVLNILVDKGLYKRGFSQHFDVGRGIPHSKKLILLSPGCGRAGMMLAVAMVTDSYGYR